MPQVKAAIKSTRRARSRAHADQLAQKKKKSVASFIPPQSSIITFEDKRREVLAQRKRQAMIDNSPRVAALRALQQKADASARVQPAPFQRHLAQRTAPTAQPPQPAKQRTAPTKQQIASRKPAKVEKKNAPVQAEGLKVKGVSWWKKPLVWAFDKALNFLGGGKKQIVSFLNQAGSAITNIIFHPVRFAGTLMKAVLGGFKGFFVNIRKYLLGGLMAFLFGALRKGGVEPPADLSLKSILKLVLQMIGLSPDQLRKDLAKRLDPNGEAKITRVEKVFDFVSKLLGGGISGLTTSLAASMGNLKQMLVTAVLGWVTQLGVRLLAKLASWLVPGLGWVKAIFEVVQFLVQKASKIATMLSAVVGSIVPLSEGKPEAAAKKIEEALGATVPVAIGLMAGLLGFKGLAKAVVGFFKKMMDRVKKKIAEIKKYIAEKAMKLFGKGKGKGKSKETKPDSKGRFKVVVPFNMMDRSHTLTATNETGRFSVLYASGGADDFLPALQNAIAEVRNSERDDKNEILDKLRGYRTAVRSLEQDYRIDENEIQKGVRTGKYLEAKSQFYKKRIAQLAAGLRVWAPRWKIKALDDFYQAPPKERYIPFKKLGYDTAGKFIRAHLYDRMHGWSAKSTQVRNRDLPGLIQQIENVQDRYKTASTEKDKERAVDAWNVLKRGGVVEKNAIIETYDPHTIQYDVDHIEPVSTRWNDTGFDKDDATRGTQVLEDANLQILTHEANVEKGGEFYREYVGPNFESSIAEGGLKNAKKIGGKRFLDAAGNPIK